MMLEKMMWSRDERPLWSPTGSQVAVRDLRRDVFLLQADGTGRWPLTQRGHVEVYCDATCTQWSADGKRLALWPRGRFLAGEGSGRQPFLPPVGQEDAALSDAEVSERYFQRLLALGLAVLPKYPYPYMLVEYAQALAHMGKVEAAEVRYREALEFVRHASPQVWSDEPVVYAYAAFLRQHGRDKEATALLASIPLIPLRRPPECGPQPTGVVPCAGVEAVSTPAGPEQAHHGTPSAPQPLPQLYIVTIPEQEK